MMNHPSNSSSFTVPLSLSTHRLAQQFCEQQTDRRRATQVYLNTLAVSAVKFYLCCMGIEVDWEGSQSYDPMWQTVLDVADLHVPHYGKVECRPVLPGAEFVEIPAEGWHDRRAYVIVQLEPSLRQATLLGFTQTVQDPFPLAQLRPMDEFMDELMNELMNNVIEESLPDGRSPQPLVKLSQWFDNLFDAGWQSVEALLDTGQMRLATSLRGMVQNEIMVKRAKLIDVGLQFNDCSLVLLIGITPNDQVTTIHGEMTSKIEVLVQLHPASGSVYLPPDVTMSMLSRSGDILQEVRSRSQDNYIQFKRFRGITGECFNIKVTLAEASIIETLEL